MDLNENQNKINNENIENINFNFQTPVNQIENSSFSNNVNSRISSNPQNKLDNNNKFNSKFLIIIIVTITVLTFIGIFYFFYDRNSDKNLQLNKISSNSDIVDKKSIHHNFSFKNILNISNSKKLFPIDESKNWQTYNFEEITFKLPENWFTRQSSMPKYFNFDLNKPTINSSHDSESFAIYIENKKLKETLEDFKNCTNEEFPCYELSSKNYIVDGKKITVLNFYHLSDDKKTKYYQFRGFIDLNEGVYIFGGFSNPLNFNELEKYYFNILSTFTFNE